MSHEFYIETHNYSVGSIHFHVGFWMFSLDLTSLFLGHFPYSYLRTFITKQKCLGLEHALYGS